MSATGFFVAGCGPTSFGPRSPRPFGPDAPGPSKTNSHTLQNGKETRERSPNQAILTVVAQADLQLPSRTRAGIRYAGRRHAFLSFLYCPGKNRLCPSFRRLLQLFIPISVQTGSGAPGLDFFQRLPLMLLFACHSNAVIRLLAKPLSRHVLLTERPTLAHTSTSYTQKRRILLWTTARDQPPTLRLCDCSPR